MHRSLAVVDDTDVHRELLAEAARLARGSDGEVVLFTTMTAEEFDSDTEKIESIERAEGTTYSDTSALDGARKVAREVAEEVFADLDWDVEYEVVAQVVEEGDRADAILDAASEYDCQHVFVVGRKRSPTGKVLFGDTAQQVILNFDGMVTITTE
ncbi:universal stress protein [Haloarchaeobius sp. DYHT-AS-18]|uniref:universal stress protein n=1 Tax=Haloarchaeobius sp. DYHT-AS-18 TaxID=3446117 RepID=UPI003EBEEE62